MLARATFCLLVTRGARVPPVPRASLGDSVLLYPPHPATHPPHTPGLQKLQGALAAEENFAGRSD